MPDPFTKEQIMDWLVSKNPHLAQIDEASRKDLETHCEILANKCLAPTSVMVDPPK